MVTATLGGVIARGELKERTIHKGQVGDVPRIEGELSVEKPDEINALIFSRQPIEYFGPAEVDGEIKNIKVEITTQPNIDSNTFDVCSSGPIAYS